MTDEETGPDRIRRAIELDRGGRAPEFPIQVCGPECRGEITANPYLGPNFSRYYREPGLRDRVLGGLVCPACIRFKFSPVHWFYRVIGICDGRNGW